VVVVFRFSKLHARMTAGRTHKMAKIKSFRAYRYDTSKVDPASVFTQPYDKITPEMQRRYAAASPYNLVTIEKGISRTTDSAADNVYTRAGRALQEWIAEKALVQDSKPSLYVYSQTFEVPGTQERRTRRGLIVRGHLEDYSAGVVFRHEQTLSGPKADRLELLRHTRAHTGQLFMLYDDPARRVDEIISRIADGEAITLLVDEFGVEHRLWRIDDAQMISEIEAQLADKKLVIADGHHRYETALAYRDERRAAEPNAGAEAPWESVMMTLVNAKSEGLVILATHRMVFGLADFSFENLRVRVDSYFNFRILSLPERNARGAEARAALADAGRVGPTIGMYVGANQFYLLTLKTDADLGAALPGVSARQRKLDVVLLHRLILEKGLGITQDAVRAESNTHYERDPGAAMKAVDEGRAQAAFLLNPVGVQEVVDLAIAGEVLPQKSTDFFPKLLSGITIYRLEN
jgi:uncharacterized protein (DUF1015 family)